MISLFFFVVSTFFILAFTFAINNYYDIDTDKENPRRAHLNAMASGKISKQTGMVLNIIFIVIPLVLSLFFTVEVFVFCAFLIFWMWAYSAPPLRLKGRAGLDILWHFIAFFALVLWGSYLAGSVSVINILVAVSLGIFGCFAQIDNHIQDYPFDKASGSKTFAVRIGIHKASVALKLSFIIYILFLIPLIVLFSFYSYLTILIVCGGIVASLLLIKIKKSTLAPSLYYVINFFGGSVYVSCLIYHISSII
jgi:chlorophyll synthase